MSTNEIKGMGEVFLCTPADLPEVAALYGVGVQAGQPLLNERHFAWRDENGQIRLVLTANNAGAIFLVARPGDVDEDIVRGFVSLASYVLNDLSGKGVMLIYLYHPTSINSLAQALEKGGWISSPVTSTRRFLIDSGGGKVN